MTAYGDVIAPEAREQDRRRLDFLLNHLLRIVRSVKEVRPTITSRSALGAPLRPG